MENALRACCKGIKIGKILIHSEGDETQVTVFLFDSVYSFLNLLNNLFLWWYNSSNVYHNVYHSIKLIYEKLPKDISERHVLLLDPVLGTGQLLIYYLFCRHHFCSSFVHRSSSRTHHKSQLFIYLLIIPPSMSTLLYRSIQVTLPVKQSSFL